MRTKTYEQRLQALTDPIRCMNCTLFSLVLVPLYVLNQISLIDNCYLTEVFDNRRQLGVESWTKPTRWSRSHVSAIYYEWLWQRIRKFNVATVLKMRDRHKHNGSICECPPTWSFLYGLFWGDWDERFNMERGGCFAVVRSHKLTCTIPKCMIDKKCKRLTSTKYIWGFSLLSGIRFFLRTVSR
jgi:hypothetical protein